MKVNRLISIIIVLLDKKRISAKDLANMFEVSIRTIYRDIDVINLAGIPIHSISGVGGGFEIMQNYKLDNTFFSSSDLSAILTGLSNLAPIVNDQEVQHALAKIKNLIPVDTAKEIELKTNQLAIDLSPWMANKDIENGIKKMKQALKDSKRLSFKYIDVHGNETFRIAEPYQLIMKGSSWYWQGFCLMRNDFRLFKLSRTINLQTLEQTFKPREYPNPILDYNDSWETIQNKIKIRIHHSIMERVLDFCSYELFTKEDEQHYTVWIPFLENDYYYELLLSFGAKCECLEPSHVRLEMQQRIQELARLYAM